ncbi:MAG: hypothetical protein ACRC33_23465 [Gemmataceae bacterium]
MATKKERDDGKRQDTEEVAREGKRQDTTGRLEGLVADGVMSALGRPAEFLRADARQVWGDSYRVNIFVGPHAGSARVLHSFFIKADGDGRILNATPPLAREYQQVTPA